VFSVVPPLKFQVTRSEQVSAGILSLKPKHRRLFNAPASSAPPPTFSRAPEPPCAAMRVLFEEKPRRHGLRTTLQTKAHRSARTTSKSARSSAQDVTPVQPHVKQRNHQRVQHHGKAPQRSARSHQPRHSNVPSRFHVVSAKTRRKPSAGIANGSRQRDRRQMRQK